MEVNTISSDDVCCDACFVEGEVGVRAVLEVYLIERDLNWLCDRHARELLAKLAAHLGVTLTEAR